MDIQNVFIVVFLAAAVFPLPVTPEDGCQPCSEVKCPPLSPECKEGTILDRCGCCKVCISEAVKICTSRETKNPDDPLCKQINSFRTSNFLRPHKQTAPLFNETNENKTNISKKFASTSDKNPHDVDNINYDIPNPNKTINERSKRYVRQQPLMYWGQKVGGMLGGAIGSALASITNTILDTPMKATLVGDVQVQTISTRMFDELLTNIGSSIGSSVTGVLGNIITSVMNAVLKIPMEANAKGRLKLENRPNIFPGTFTDPILKYKRTQKRSLHEVNHMVQMPWREGSPSDREEHIRKVSKRALDTNADKAVTTSINVTKNFSRKPTKNEYDVDSATNYDMPYENKTMNERNKRYVLEEPFIFWGEKIGQALGGALVNALASLANTVSNIPMKAKMAGGIHLQNTPNLRSGMDTLRNNENAEVSITMFDGLLQDILNGIGSSVTGVLGNIATSVMNAVLKIPMETNAKGNLRLENRPSRTSRGVKSVVERSLGDVNPMIEIPSYMSLLVSENEGPLRYKGQIQHELSSDREQLSEKELGGTLKGGGTLNERIKRHQSFDHLGPEYLEIIAENKKAFLQSNDENVDVSTRMFDGLLTNVASSIGSSITGVLGNVITSIINTVLQIPMEANAKGRLQLENRPNIVYRSSAKLTNDENVDVSTRMFDGLLTNIASNIGSSITGVLGNVVTSIINTVLQIPIQANAKGKLQLENRPNKVSRSIKNAVLSSQHTQKRSLSELNHMSQVTSSDSVGNVGDILKGLFGTTVNKHIKRSINTAAYMSNKKVPRQHQMLWPGFSASRYRRSLDAADDTNYMTSNAPLEQKRKAVKVFTAIFGAGIRNLYTNAVGTNLVKRATKGDLQSHLQQLLNALMFNNAELLSYITNAILMNVSILSSNLRSQNLIKMPVLANETELSPQGIKAHKTAMIALNAIAASNVTHDIEKFLDVVQVDIGLLIRKLLKTELSETLLSIELTQFISEMTIPLINILGDLSKEFIHVLIESVDGNTLYKTTFEYPIMPYVQNTSVVDALLERILLVTDSSVAETIYHLTQTLLQQEIAYISELITDDEFLSSIIKMKYLSLMSTSAKKFGTIFIEKLAHVLKVITLSLHELTLQIKKGNLTSNYSSEVMSEIPKIHRAAVLAQDFLNHIGKGLENILLEILQTDFVHKTMNKDINNFLIENTHSVRGKAAKIMGYLIEILLKLLDQQITGSKQPIFENLEEYLSSDFIITFKAILKSLDEKLSDQNTQQLQNTASKLGSLGARALEMVLNSRIAKTFLNKKFLESISAIMHAYGRTITKFIGLSMYKGVNKMTHKYMKRIDISDIEAKQVNIINDLARKLTSQNNTQHLKKLVKLTVLKAGALIADLLKTELVNAIINNKTALELSQFALQNCYSIGEQLSAAAELVLNGIHILASGKKQAQIHRIKRSSENVLDTMAEIAQGGFNAILRVINYLTSSQMVGIINNVIIALIKLVAKIIHHITNTHLVQRFITPNAVDVIKKFTTFLDESVGRMVGAAVTAVLNFVHNMSTSSTLSHSKIPWDKIGSLAKRGLELIGKFASSISTPENTRIVKNFIHILSTGLADIAHDVLDCNLMRRMVGKNLAISLSTVVTDLVVKAGHVGAWLIGKVMNLMHYILARFGFNNDVGQRINLGNVLSDVNNFFHSFTGVIRRVTAPEVVKDIMEVINIVAIKGARLGVSLIKSELGIKLLNFELAEAAASLVNSMGHSGGRLLSLVVQRILNFIHSLTSHPLRSMSSVGKSSECINFGSVKYGLRKVSLHLIDLLLKIVNGRTIGFLKSSTQIVSQGIATSIGSILNSNIGHQFFLPDFTAALEKILVSLGRYGGSIAATILEKLLNLFRLAMEELRIYLSNEVGSRMMFGDMFTMIKSGIKSLTRPKIARDLEELILLTGIEGGYLLKKIFTSPFMKNMLSVHLAEALARAAPTISGTFAQIIAFVVKDIMSLIHNILSGQGISSRSYPLMTGERIFLDNFPAIKGILGIAFRIAKGLSSPNNARAIKHFVVLIGKGLGNLIKEILQSELAHKILQPAFAKQLAYVAEYIGYKGGQFLGYLIEQCLAIMNQVLRTEGDLSMLTFKTIARRLMGVAKNILRRLTTPSAAKFFNYIIQKTFRDLGNIASTLLRSGFAKSILNAQLATSAEDFILQTSQAGGQFFGEMVNDLLNIIYRLLSSTNNNTVRGNIIRGKRSIQERSRWQILSAAAMKGLRFLQGSLQYITRPEAVAKLKHFIASTGNQAGILIAHTAQSKFAKSILNKHLAEAIAKFARAVGDLGGKLLGEVTAAALSHINYLININTAESITARSGIAWYKASSAGLTALEFIGKMLSFISSPEITYLMKDFLHILLTQLANLVHDVFRSRLAKRLVGMNLAVTLSEALKEAVKQFRGIGTLLLERTMHLVHSFLTKFGISNVKVNDILPPDVLQSLAEVVQKCIAPDVIEDIVQLVEMVCERISLTVAMLIQSKLAGKFLNHKLVAILAKSTIHLGNHGRKLVSKYVKLGLQFLNSALSQGGVSMRALNQVSTRINLNNIGSIFKHILLYLLALFINLLNTNNIAHVKFMLYTGIERGMAFIASLVNNKMMNGYLNPKFARTLQSIIIKLGKHAASIIAEIVAKGLAFLAFTVRNVKTSLTELAQITILPWKPGTALPNLGLQ